MQQKYESCYIHYEEQWSMEKVKDKTSRHNSVWEPGIGRRDLSFKPGDSIEIFKITL